MSIGCQMSQSQFPAPTNHAERVALVKLSSKDNKAKVNYQIACDKLLEPGERPFLAFMGSLLPEDRQLLNYHLGNDGKMLLHRICSGANSTTAKIINGLYAMDSIDVGMPSRDGMYPLHTLATLPSLVQGFNALLSCGANPNAQVISTGNTAAHIIANRLDFEMLSILKDYDADFSIQNKEGKTISDIIKEKGTEQDYANWTSILAALRLRDLGLVESNTNTEDGAQLKRSARAL